MKNILLKTNIIVCIIIITGFLVTAILSYRANYSASLENIEQVSELSSEGIYYQMTSTFSKPINISMTMANDSLLKSYLQEEQEHLNDGAYIETIREYLDSYQKKYSYESVFLVSCATNRYYNFRGVDRVLEPGNQENTWYYNFLNGNDDCSLNVDNDEAADNEITVFVNCKIVDRDNTVLGVVGVGMRVDYLQALLRQYKDEFGVNTYFVDKDGYIEISQTHTGYKKENLFSLHGYSSDVKEKILTWDRNEEAESIWTPEGAKKSYIVERYIPELSWHLIVERDTSEAVTQLKVRLYQTMAVIVAIILIILLVITSVIRKFNRQITRLTEQQQENFRKATEQLYENIYELDITKNRAGGKSTERYFESLDIPKGTPFDQALTVIAKKQIKEEFRQGYIDMFKPEHVMEEFEKGNDHLSYDFLFSHDGETYFWMRIDAHIYRRSDDGSVRMFTYRKNINAEKRQERLMHTDEMTSLFTKAATQRHIEKTLSQNNTKQYAFFIFDIDNFKYVNDHYGHAFGDRVIIEFAGMLKKYFQKNALIGRIGGDEFAAFMEFSSRTQLENMAAEISRKLDTVFTFDSISYHISASIGVALFPQDADTFDGLYKNADAALYATKRRGKNGYSFYHDIDSL